MSYKIWYHKRKPTDKNKAVIVLTYRKECEENGAWRRHLKSRATDPSSFIQRPMDEIEIKEYESDYRLYSEQYDSIDSLIKDEMKITNDEQFVTNLKNAFQNKKI